MSFASISTVAVSLLVLGMFLLIFLNTNNLAQYLESQVQVSVYMQDNASAEELKAVEAKLKKMPGVVKVTPVSKQQALARFKERLGDQEQLLNSLGKDNPFPNSFEVQVDNPERIKVITPSIGQLPKVETAKFGQEVVEHLFSLTKILRFGGIVLVIFLAMATLFIISNTIRLTVFARRKEVVIMKYVGATDWFIRWPFLLEGMTLGFFGAVIASVCINSLYAGLLERIHATLAFLPLLPTTPFLLLTAALYFKGSPRLYNWLLNHRHFGPYIRNFRENKAIPLRAKIISLVLMWGTMLYCIFFLIPFIWVKILLGLIAAGVTYHILSFKTLK